MVIRQGADEDHCGGLKGSQTAGPRQGEGVIDTKMLAMVALAGSVAAGYVVIALVVAPRIRMPSASPRMLVLVRGAAMMFLLGCGFTHLHILAHTLGVGGPPRPVETHELAFHVAQAAGAWLFIAGAAMKLELHVVAAGRTAKQRDAARVQLAEQQVATATFRGRATRATALARISEQALTLSDPGALLADAAASVRAALPDGCTLTVGEGRVTPAHRAPGSSSSTARERATGRTSSSSRRRTTSSPTPCAAWSSRRSCGTGRYTTR